MARATDMKTNRQLARPGAARATTVRSGPPVQDRIVRYLRDVRAELIRVEWPSRAELIAMTVVVIVVLLAMSLYLGAWDAMFTWLFQKVLVKR
ncbi:MAG TPA: preprotein translocase subunit SecE [bacterium]